MPEKFSIEPSLEQAFQTLTAEVSERTASPGAPAAIGAARRRRTTTVLSAAAAVVAIAVGGSVLAQGGGDRLSPAGLPSPAPLDAGVLNAATVGYASDWHVAGPDDEKVVSVADFGIDCGGSSRDGHGDPERVGGNMFVAGNGGYVAYAVFADFGADTAAATASVAELTNELESCAPGGGTTTLYGDQGAVTLFAMSMPGPVSRQVWVARLDNRLAMVMVNGARSLPGDSLDEPIIAALQADASYTMGDALKTDSGTATAVPAPSETSAPPDAHAGIAGSDLAAALDGWSTWAETGDIASPSLPCLTSPSTSSSGSGQSVGTTGELSVYDFDSEQAALQGMQQLVAKLAACSNGPWDLDSTTVTDAVIGSHPEGTVWVVRNGSRLAAFTLGGASNPPAGVRSAVADLVRETL